MTVHEETYLEASKKYIVKPHSEPSKWERVGGKIIVESHGIMVKDSDSASFYKPKIIPHLEIWRDWKVRGTIINPCSLITSVQYSMVIA